MSVIRLSPSKAPGFSFVRSGKRGGPIKAGAVTEEQIIALLQDAKKGEKTVKELCRNLQVRRPYYLWKKRHGVSSVVETNGLLEQNSAAGDTCQFRRLEREDVRLLKIVGQQHLELDGMQEILTRKERLRSASEPRSP